MIGWLRRRRERKRLAPVAGALPAALIRSYGPAAFYSVAQVRAAAANLGLPRSLDIMALAACCRESDVLLAEPTMNPVGYRKLRAHLAKVFRIDQPKFTCEHLLALRNVPRTPPQRMPGDGGSGHPDGAGMPGTKDPD